MATTNSGSERVYNNDGGDRIHSANSSPNDNLDRGVVARSVCYDFNGRNLMMVSIWEGGGWQRMVAANDVERRNMGWVFLRVCRCS